MKTLRHVALLCGLYLVNGTSQSLAQTQMTYPSTLTNEQSGQPISSSTTKCVVLIHGWNPGGALDCYDINNGFEFFNLLTNLKAKLNGTGWNIVAYHWEKDAATGSIANIVNDIVQFDPTPPNQAAANAQLHGAHLAAQLNSLAPNLREVQFIAHSAGSWAAREAAEQLLQLNPYVVVQITLLDPYIPDPAGSTGSDFSDSAMSGVASFPGNGRIQRLENYFANDSPEHGWNAYPWGNYFPPTIDTQEQFSWRGGMDINQEVDWGATLVNPPGPNSVTYAANYDWHAGPIQFYADTVSADLFPQSVPGGLFGNGCPWSDFKTVGWFQSLCEQDALFPQITNQPQGQTVQDGNTTTFSVQANAVITYQWYVNGVLQQGATNSTFAVVGNSTNAGNSYVVQVANANGEVFSQSATLSVTPANATLSISGLQPRTLDTLPSAQTQHLAVAGTGFTQNSKLRFTRLDDNYTYPDATPQFVSSTDLEYDISVGTTARSWSVSVVDGNANSLPYTFYVVANTAQLIGLSLGGPPTVNENSSGQFSATALFADGSSPTVSANWSVSGGGSISSTGLYTAGSVSSSTPIIIMGTYSSGGVTKTQSASLTVIDTGATGGAQTQNLIINGGFENGTSGWNATGGAGVNTISGSSVYAHTGSSYLILGGASGESDALNQNILVPANATAATLSFYLNISSAEGGSAPIDTMTATVRDLNGDILATIGSWSNLQRDTAAGNPFYHQQSFNLLPYKGQAVQIYFSSVNNATNITSFRLDDVSVQAVVGPAITLTALVISGPTSIVEDSKATYTATGIFSDGSTTIVTPIWSVAGDVASIDGVGEMTAGSVANDTVVTVSASYSPAGVTKFGSTNVTIVNVNPPGNTPPLTPSTASPLDNATGQSLTPTLQASAFSDSSNGATHYASWWQVLDSTGTSVLWESGEDFANLTSIVVPSGKLAYSTNYVWRVRYEDSLDQWSDYSASNSFTTLSNPTPEPDDNTDYRWVVRGGGSANSDAGQGVCIDATGNIYTTGYFYGTADFGSQTLTDSGGGDVFLAKYSADGRLLWAQSAGGAGFDQGFSVAAGADGRVYVVGTTGGNAQFGTGTGALTLSQAGLFVACYTSNGVPVWVHSYGDSAAVAHRILIDSTGNLVVAGTFYATSDFGGVSLTFDSGGPGNDDIFVMKLSSSDGSAVWAQQAGSTNFDEAYGLALDAQDRIYVVGTTRGWNAAFGQITLNRTTGLFDAFMACYDTNGNVLWAKSYGVQGNNYAKAVVVDSAGNIYLAGVYNDTPSFESSTSTNSFAKFFIIKTDSQGNQLWTREFGSGTSNNGGYFGMSFKDIGLGIDNRGSIVVSGVYSGTVTVGTFQITSQASVGDVDTLTTKIDSAGNFIWLKTGTSQLGEYPCDIAVSPSGVIYQTGRFWGTTSFSGLSVTSVGSSDYFLARMSGPLTYTLTVYAQNGIVNQSQVETSYAAGAQIVLTPAPATHYRFSGWSGDASGIASPLTVTVNSNMVVTANFVEQAFVSLETNPGIGGTVSGDGIYDVGATATLVATPATGWEFQQWNDGAVNPIRTISVSSGGSIYTAIFSQIGPPSFGDWLDGLGLSGANAEPDAHPFTDTIPNLARYAMNLDTSPVPGDLPSTSVVSVSGTSYLTIQYRVRKNMTGVQVVPQFSTNLINWTNVPTENITQLLDDDTNTARFQAEVVLPSNGEVFLRVAMVQE